MIYICLNKFSVDYLKLIVQITVSLIKGLLMQTTFSSKSSTRFHFPIALPGKEQELTCYQFNYWLSVLPPIHSLTNVTTSCNDCLKFSVDCLKFIIQISLHATSLFFLSWIAFVMSVKEKELTDHHFSSWRPVLPPVHKPCALHKADNYACLTLTLFPVS